ncbi:hypothetical protein ACFL28_03920 [Candidatus Omnitrophota bacterium]
MLRKKITRKDFLRTGFLGILAMLILPILKMFSAKEDTSRKEARYYKDLAG